MLNYKFLKHKKIFFTALSMIILLLIILVMAAPESIDNIKNKINISKGENYILGNKTIDYNYLWDEYKPVEILNGSDKIFQGAITEHDEICGTNCDSILDIYLKNRGVLISNITFYEINGKTKTETTIENYTIYLKIGNKPINATKKEWKCINSGVYLNLTIRQNCTYKLVNYTYYEPIWGIYNIGDEVEAGNNQIKITGIKNFYKTIDWQIETQGIWIEDWADWGAGGTVTYDGDFVIHTFLANGSFNVTSEGNISFLIVAGGGAGGGNTNNAGGGGGAGGILFGGAYTLSAGNWSVVVGNGGAGGSSATGGNGTNSSFAGFVARGGGGGGHSTPDGNGMDGGSGGGCNNGLGGKRGGRPIFTNYAETTEYGMWGGCSGTAGLEYGGGGGAATNGTAGGWSASGKGGNGTTFTIYNGTAIYYGGGGGASGNNGGAGGLGGGGTGQGLTSGVGSNGVINRGGGGGACANSTACIGYSGGSGIVIIRYENPITAIANVTLNAPANNYNSSLTTVTFNCSANASGGVLPQNISLWHNSTGTFHLNQTNSTISNSTNITIFTSPFSTADGYIWTCSMGLNNGTRIWAGQNRTLNVDTIAPNIAITNPANNSNSTNVNLVINYTTSDTHQGNCWYSNDSYAVNTTLADCGTNISITWTEGQHNVTVWANDTYGNTNSSSVTFLIDTTYPLISYGTNTAVNYANLSQNWIYINTTWTETNFANITFNLYNSSWNNITTYITSTYLINFTNLANGNYWYYVNITDTANNRNSTSIYNITLDTINPQINIITPANNSNSSDTGLDVNYTISDTNLDSCWYSNDTYAVNTTLAGCGNITSVVWIEGQHNVTVWANDSAGNVNSSYIVFGIFVAPVIVINYPANSSYNINVSELNYSVIEENPGSCWYSLDLGVTNSSPQNCGLNWTGLSSSEGSNTWTIYANDTYGNVSSNNVTFSKDTVIPNITINAPLNNTIYADAINFNITATDTSGISSCWFSLNGGNNITLTNLTANDYNFTNTTINQNNYFANFYCNDTLNNINSSEVSFTIDWGGSAGEFWWDIYNFDVKNVTGAHYVRFVNNNLSSQNISFYNLTNALIHNGTHVINSSTIIVNNNGSINVSIRAAEVIFILNRFNLSDGYTNVYAKPLNISNSSQTFLSRVIYINNNMSETLNQTDVIIDIGTRYCSEITSAIYLSNSTTYTKSYGVADFTGIGLHTCRITLDMIEPALGSNVLTINFITGSPSAGGTISTASIISELKIDKITDGEKQTLLDKIKGLEDSLKEATNKTSTAIRNIVKGDFGKADIIIIVVIIVFFIIVIKVSNGR